MLILVIVLNMRLQNSRIGRAWEAIREDEVAARAMGINTVALKLLAFGIGATLAGTAGTINVHIGEAIEPNAYQFIFPALLLSFVPEVLRYTVGPVQQAVFGRMLIDPEVIRMLLFGFTLVLMMLFRPAGILPSALRKRELETKRAA